MTRLRVYLEEWPKDPFFNLAFEEAFYLLSEEPTLRLWRNDKVIVIGRHQCALLEVNPLEAKILGVKLVRRFTGGGAVYHDLGNLNYALTIPRGFKGIKNIEEAFKFVGEIVVNSLKKLGVNANYKPLNDIEISGRKVSGMAATISSNKVFVHGALLIKSDLSALWKVLKISEEKLSDKKFISSRRKIVITLEEALDKEVDIKNIIELLSYEFARSLGFQGFEIVKAEEELLKFARKLYDEKYSTLNWNLKYLDFVKDHISDIELESLISISRP